jgi:hypothetical protein
MPAKEPPPNAEPAHAHTGFALRLAAGFGYIHSADKHVSDDLRYEGGASSVMVSIGGSPVENLFLSADLFGVTCGHRKVRIDGTDVEGNFDLTAAGLGFGVSWYFTPINIYVHATVGLSTMFITEPDGVSSKSKAGWGISLMVGKEWWVSENWGLGVALQGVILDTPRKEITSDMRTYWTGLLFSATYN